MPHVFDTTQALIQSTTAQDMVVTGVDYNMGTAFIVVADGHGTGKVVERARKFNWNQLLEAIDVDIQTIVQPFVDEQCVPDTEMDGMTLTIVRVRSNYFKNGDTLVELAWIGDSLVSITQTNGGFRTSEERIKFFNPEYVVHPALRGRTTSERVKSFYVENEDELKVKWDYYFHFKPSATGEEDEVINMTGAIGHKGTTHHPLFQHAALLPASDSFVIRAASDGWWNVMHTHDWSKLTDPNVSSAEVAELALERWNKNNWTYDPTEPDGEEVEKTSFASLGEADDISVGTLLIYPRPGVVSYTPRRIE